MERGFPFIYDNMPAEIAVSIYMTETQVPLSRGDRLGRKRFRSKDISAYVWSESGVTIA